MSKRIKKSSKLGNVLFNFVINNKREFLQVVVLFFVGLIIGVMFMNNLNDVQNQEIQTYFSNLTANVQNTEGINLFNLLKKSITSNVIFVIVLWLGAATIIGIPIVYGTIIFKGFSVGFTISSIMYIYGSGNGILVSISLLLLQNIILIPAMFSFCVSGARLYKSIMKNKERDNIKVEILRHTFFCLLMLILMIIASLIEVYISTNLFIILLKYIKI